MPPVVPPSDPLFPHAGLLPLSEPGGGHVPLPHTPGPLRPFAATLAVPLPVDAKKHDTARTSRVVKQRTQRSDDGKVVQDTVSVIHTDD